MTYEDLDAHLLNHLLGDGRASLRSLAAELDVSVTTVSNHLQSLEDDGVIAGYSPRINYEALGYDVTAILQLKVEGRAIPEVTTQLREQQQMTAVYEVTGDYDIIAVGKFRDTDEMNEQIKRVLTDTEVRDSNTSVVLNSVLEGNQFELNTDKYVVEAPDFEALIPPEELVRSDERGTTSSTSS